MNSISAAALKNSLFAKPRPLVLDVRRNGAFRDAVDAISGALRRDPDAVGQWAKALPSATSVVVYCVDGHEVSQGVARALEASGIRASYLEGGIAAWKASEGALDRKP